MDETSQVLPNLSRRTFIKGAAAMVAAGAVCNELLPGHLGVAEAAENGTATDQIYSGACRGNCDGGCYLNVHVRDGRVVRTTAGSFPEPEYDRICPRGLTQVGRIYSSKRLQYPMKRVGERGSGEFERISWDEALDTIVEKWKGFSDEYGPGSMAVLYGSGNYAVCSGVGAASATNRFINVTGASYINMDTDLAGVPTGHVAPGMALGVGEPRDYHNAKTFACWGANPSVSQPHNMHFIFDAKDNGARYVVIDPLYNANAAKADWYVPIKATTDGALAFGVINELIDNGWVDEEFVRDKTNAPFLIKEDGMFLRASDLGEKPGEDGSDPYLVWDEETSKAVPFTEAARPALEGVDEVEGIAVRTAYANLKRILADYPVETVSQITGVSAEDIHELARIYGEDGPVMTYVMMGNNHYLNGHYNYWSRMLVSILSGNCGMPGASLGSALFVPGIINGASASPVSADGTPRQGQHARYNLNQVEHIIDDGMYGSEPQTLKGCYITNLNPLATMTDYEYQKRWMSKMEFVVVVDMFATETTNYADIVLPACHWFEQVDMFTSYGTAPYLIWQEKAVEPLYESRSDFSIMKEIATRLGYGEYFDITEEDFIAEQLDSDGARALGITVDGLKEHKAARTMAPYEELREQMESSPFSFLTATGRAELYTDTITKFYDIGQDYPMEKEVEPYWEPSPEAGDLVRLYNDRGHVVMKAVINAGLPQGTLSTPRAWEAHEFVEGHMQSLLTNENIYATPNQVFNEVAVAIEKY